MTIKIYLRYCIHRLAGTAAAGRFSIRSIKFWWKVYLLLFIFAMAFYYKTREQSYMLFIIMIFIAMVIITIYKDYISGDHMHWWRGRYAKAG